MASFEEKQAAFQELKNRGSLEGKDPSVVAELEKRFGAGVQEVPQAPKVSATESALTGAGQGVTLGFGEEGAAVAEKGLAGLVRGGFGQSPYSPQERIAAPTAKRIIAQPIGELISEGRKQISEAEAAHPTAFGAGKLGGALLTAVPASFAGSVAPVLGKAAPIITGGAIGGVSALGESDKESLGSAAQDVAIGTTVGLGFGLAAKGILAAPAIAKKAAANMSRRALGFIKGTIKKAGGKAKVDKAAEILLKEGAVKGGLNDVAENVVNLRNEAGQVIGGTLDKLDDAGIRGVFDGKKLVQTLRDSRPDPGVDLTLDQMMKLPAFQTVAKQYQNILATADDPLFQAGTFKAAQRLKSVFRSLAFKEGRDIPGKELAKKAYLVVRDSIDEAIEGAAPKIGNPNLAKEFKAAKEVYGAAKTAEIGLDDAIASASGNRILSLTDLIFAANLGAGPGGPAAAASVIAKKGLESTTAKTLAARGLSAAGGLADKVAPAARVLPAFGVGPNFGGKQ